MKSIRIGNDIRIEWPIVLSGDVEKLQDLDLTVEVRPSMRIIDSHNYADAIGEEGTGKDGKKEDRQPPFEKTEVTVMMNGGMESRPNIGDGKGHCRPRPPRPCPPRPLPPAPVRLPYHIEDNTLIAMWTADRQFATGDYDIMLYAHKNEGGQAVCDQYRFVRLVSHSAQADAPDDSGLEAVIAMQPVTLELSGLSAYEVAVVNGFTGTEEEWLASLKQPAEDAAEELKEEIEEFKTETKEELEEDITNLNANTGIDEYPVFSDQTAYATGDVVNYQGKLYKFTSDHAAGAWAETDVEGWSLKEEFNQYHITWEIGSFNGAGTDIERATGIRSNFISGEEFVFFYDTDKTECLINIVEDGTAKNVTVSPFVKYKSENNKIRIFIAYPDRSDITSISSILNDSKFAIISNYDVELNEAIEELKTEDEELNDSIFENKINIVSLKNGDNSAFSEYTAPVLSSGNSTRGFEYDVVKGKTYELLITSSIDVSSYEILTANDIYNNSQIESFGRIYPSEGLAYLKFTPEQDASAIIIVNYSAVDSGLNTIYIREYTQLYLEEDITNLNANTGIDEYPVFSDQTAYATGDVVNYQGKLYKFTSDHAAGAWAETDVEGWSLKEEIEEFKTETKEELEEEKRIIINKDEKGYYSYDADELTLTSADNWYNQSIDVEDYSFVKLMPCGGKQGAILFVDDNDNIIARISDTDSTKQYFFFKIPNGTSRIITSYYEGYIDGDLSVYLYKCIYDKKRSLINEIVLEQGSFNGAGTSVDNDARIRTQQLCDIGILTVKYPNDFKMTVNQDNLNKTYYCGLNKIVVNGYFRISFAKIDDTDISPEDITPEFCISLEDGDNIHDFTIAASNSSLDDKNIADYICDGENDRDIIWGCLESNDEEKVNVKLCAGDYYIQGIQDTNYLEEDNYMPAIFKLGHYSNKIYTIKGCPGVNLILSESVYDSIGEQFSMFGCKYNTYNSNTRYGLDVEGLYIYTNTWRIPIIVINLQYFFKFSLFNIRIYNGSYPYDVQNKGWFFDEEENSYPIEGSVGIRFTNGGNAGIFNLCKSVACFSFYEAFQIGGDHHLIEDCLAYTSYIGYSFGNYSITMGSSEHNITLLNCSMEQCYMIALFTRDGSTEETQNVQEVAQQVVEIINLSTEAYYKTSEGSSVRVNPAKEIVKNMWSGKITHDFAAPFFEDGCGKAFDVHNLRYRTRGSKYLRAKYLPDDGMHYFDTTLNKELIYIDSQWYDLMGNSIDEE